MLRVRLLFMFVLALCVMGALLVYVLVAGQYAKPFLDAWGVWDVAVLLAGAAGTIWLAVQVAWLLIKALIPVRCPACAGWARLRGRRRYLDEPYLTFGCRAYGHTWEVFGWSTRQSMGHR